MTNREAVETLNRMLFQYEWDYPMDYLDALDMALEALANVEEKGYTIQMPRIVMHDERTITARLDKNMIDGLLNVFHCVCSDCPCEVTGVCGSKSFGMCRSNKDQDYIVEDGKITFVGEYANHKKFVKYVKEYTSKS